MTKINPDDRPAVVRSFRSSSSHPDSDILENNIGEVRSTEVDVSGISEHKLFKIDPRGDYEFCNARYGADDLDVWDHELLR